MNFRSDNEAPIAPAIMTAIQQANQGAAHAYGQDDWTARLQDRFCELFECQLTVFPLVSGTAANALCLAHATPSYGGIICHDRAHVYVDECGAPEFYTGGAKLLPVESDHGKLTATVVQTKIQRMGGHHDPQLALLTITQATECGTVYDPREIADLCQLAHRHGMHTHMDGARFANAVVSLDCRPAEISWQAGIDMLSFGATKNGAMAAEAAIFFKPEQARGFALRRMKSGHLISKSRFIAAQLMAYLEDGLWLRLARHANTAARRLGEALAMAPGVRILHPVQANEVFVELPRELHARLCAAGFEYRAWPGASNLYRLVVPHDVETADLERFATVVTGDR